VGGERRGLPEQASLRYLKLEAKRRVAAGEFPALNQAQLAIAREHGQPSWAALRSAVAARDPAHGEGHALTQVRWIIARFSGAGQPGWNAPDDDEFRAHFTDSFLTNFPPDRLIGFITGIAAELSAEFTVDVDLPFIAQGRFAGYVVMAIAESRSPYRLSAARLLPADQRISDPRATSTVAAGSGEVPGEVPALAAKAVAQLGLVGLALAGGTRDVDLTGAAPGGGTAARENWTTATGWADLERAEPLGAACAFPAYGITMAVTAIAVLRLAAAGRLRLDNPANRYLDSVRLSDDAVTVRELLAHTGGVSDDPAIRLAPAVPVLTEVVGPVLRCSGRRGAFGPSLTGYAALGEVLAGLTGEPYQEAVTRLVLEPLGMRASWFPDRWPDHGAAGHPAVTGYTVAADSTFTPAQSLVCAFLAAGGLWTTAADMVRLGLGWRSLLPPSLATQALRPHASRPNGAQSGLGWIVNEGLGLAGHAGEGPGAAGSLLITLDGRHACAALANRLAPMEPLNAKVLQALGGLRQPYAAGSA
jgi:CubicO group peptidase (beta-lactamase class C family)